MKELRDLKDLAIHVVQPTSSEYNEEGGGVDDAKFIFFDREKTPRPVPTSGTVLTCYPRHPDLYPPRHPVWVSRITLKELSQF